MTIFKKIGIGNCRMKSNKCDVSATNGRISDFCAIAGQKSSPCRKIQFDPFLPVFHICSFPCIRYWDDYVCALIGCLLFAFSMFLAALLCNVFDPEKSYRDVQYVCRRIFRPSNTYTHMQHRYMYLPLPKVTFLWSLLFVLVVKAKSCQRRYSLNEP